MNKDKQEVVCPLFNKNMKLFDVYPLFDIEIKENCRTYDSNGTE